MNALSNHVLAVLFSWMRTLVQGAWGAMSSGTSTGFWPWLGDHWALLVVLLCLVCTVLDYLVWLIRWRPYVLWRQKLHRLFHRNREDVLKNDQGFRHGYSDGVNLDLQDVPAPTEQDPAEWDAAPGVPSIPLEEIYPDPAPLGRFNSDEDVPDEEETPQPEETSRTRHRRSARHGSRRKGQAKRFFADDAQTALAGDDPPEADQESMFREPVYPQRSPYPSWQMDDEQRRNG